MLWSGTVGQETGILPNSEISTDVWAGSCTNTEEATTHPGWGVLFAGGKKDANQSQVGVLYWRKRPSKGALRWAGWGTEFLVTGRTMETSLCQLWGGQVRTTPVVLTEGTR